MRREVTACFNVGMVIILCLLVSCSSGSGSGSSQGSSSTDTNSSPPEITVSLSAPKTEIGIGTSAQFSASVSGTSNIGVEWQVNGVTGGNETVGEISDTGYYTAPVSPPDPATVTITAVSKEDQNSSASASVNILSSFSLATIDGRYAFRNVGLTANTSFVGAGFWVADGEGNLSGIQDLNTESGFASVSLNGSYTVDESGVGTTTISTPDGTFELSSVMIDAAHGRYIAVDDSQVLVGEFWRQDTGSFSESTFDRDFAFRLGAQSDRALISAIGAIRTDGAGNITSGHEAVNQNGAIDTQVDVTGGSYTISSETGRGDAEIEVSSSAGTSSTTFKIYVVDSDRVIVLSQVTDFPVIGELRRRDEGNFGIGSVAGDFAFEADGVSQSGNFASIGRFTSDGSGNISQGRRDVNDGGTISNGAQFSGGYSIEPDGRGTATLDTSSGSVGLTVEVISADQLFFMQTDAGQVISGTARAQEDDFANETLSGSYAVLGSGVTSDSIITLVGVAEPDGGGTLSLDLDRSSFDVNTATVTVDTVEATGTYQIENDGRGTATVSDLSDNLRVYAVSTDKAVFLTLDQFQLIAGGLSKRL